MSFRTSGSQREAPSGPFRFLSAISTESPLIAPKKYLNLPVRSVKPTGWLHDQLIVQINGLARHEHDFYKYDWTGGSSFYSNLEEAGTPPTQRLLPGRFADRA
ncbi:hypothetical protein LXA43DRAFT_573071 [Ganoderma leucocontextum]|nr:hypothetical protein LXA43DRAFT_573071 [Ganoderma leucocontextum]